MGSKKDQRVHGIAHQGLLYSDMYVNTGSGYPSDTSRYTGRIYQGETCYFCHVFFIGLSQGVCSGQYQRGWGLARLVHLIPLVLQSQQVRDEVLYRIMDKIPCSIVKIIAQYNFKFRSLRFIVLWSLPGFFLWIFLVLQTEITLAYCWFCRSTYNK